MGNIRELLINVVRTSKPKMLSGLNQKVCGSVYRFPFPNTQTISHRRRGRP